MCVLLSHACLHTKPTLPHVSISVHFALFQDPSSTLKAKLFGFDGAYLAPGESVKLHFEVTPSSLAVGTTNGQVTVLPGLYTIQFTRGHGPSLRTQVQAKGVILEQY